MTYKAPQTDRCFMPLGTPSRVWAVSAIHAELNHLTKLHDDLYNAFRIGDRIVYLGNYTGYGRKPCETIDELLTFRRNILAMPGMVPEDIVYLRGGQEEIFQKFLQLHYAPDPVDTLVWMLGNGLSSVLEGYGFCPHDVMDAAREGNVALARLTCKTKDMIRHHKGHDIFYMQQKRAAYTEGDQQCPAENNSLLFVNAGLNPQKPLQAQGDSFWWSAHEFSDIKTAYDPFARVIRGYDPKHKAPYINGVTASIDGGCGFGGSLIAACFGQDGHLLETLEV